MLAVELEMFPLFSSSSVKLLLLLSNARLRFVVLVFQHAARYLANQEWVKNDSLKTGKYSCNASSFELCYFSFSLILATSFHVSSHTGAPLLVDTYYYACGGSSS